MASSTGLLISIGLILFVIAEAAAIDPPFDATNQVSFNDLQEEQAVKVLDPWYDISKDLDSSEAVYERQEKPVAINVELTPYRMQIAKKPVVWKNNFSKRSVYLFSNVDFGYRPFHIARYLSPYRMKKSNMDEEDPNYWKLLGRMGRK